MTVSNTQPRAEHWTPQNPQLRAILGPLQQQADQNTPYSMEHLDSVGIIEIEQANAVAFLGATPHTDKDFDRWFILYTLHNPQNSVLHTARKVKAPKNRPLKSDLSVPLNVGEVCVFDAHRLHWVERPVLPELSPPPELSGRELESWKLRQYRDKMTIALATETAVRPTRDEAEQLLAEYLRQVTPYCWNEAKKAEEAKPGRRRKP